MYQMIQKYTTYKVLRLFFDFPTRRFQLREMSRQLHIGMPSLKMHIKRLEKEKLIKKEKNGVWASYRASRNETFMMYKRCDVLLRLRESGIIDVLVDECAPNALVLFGSASRGEDIEGSDIDILVVAEEKNIMLKKYEATLKRKIHLTFEGSPKKLPKELLNNIINGIVIYGYVKVL